MLLLLGLLPASVQAASFDCLMEPRQTVELSSPVTGLIDKVYVKRGDVVRKGQVLVTLDARAETAAMEAALLRSKAMGPTLSAQGKIEFSSQKYERRKLMAEQQLLPGQDRDDAESELRLAQAELRTAEENREIAAREYAQQARMVAQRTLKSPFDGVVTDRLLSPGELTESSGTKKAILKLARIDPIRVHVVLPETMFGRLSVGESVEVRPQYQEGKKHFAKVAQIDRVIDAASGTFSAFLEIPNPKMTIPAGMRCKIDL